MKKTLLSILSITVILSACEPKQAVPESTSTVTATATVIESTGTAAPPSPTIQPTWTLVPSPTPFTSRSSPADGMTQLFIPAGSLFMGGLDVLLENDEIPAHHVQLDAYWIDQVEVTNGMYALCVGAGACRPPAKTNSDNRGEYYGDPEFQDYPVVHVTWYDANAYCQWAGRRLPSEAEWERAARGDDMRTFPWGDEPPNAYNSNSLNIVGDTSRVGSYPQGMSPFGALDMAGNVWEWVADYYDPYYYAKSPDTNPPGPATAGLNDLRVIRGGSFQDDLLSLRLANRGYEVGPDPIASPGQDAYYGRATVRIGFRCAQGN